MTTKWVTYFWSSIPNLFRITHPFGSNIASAPAIKLDVPFRSIQDRHPAPIRTFPDRRCCGFYRWRPAFVREVKAFSICKTFYQWENVKNANNPAAKEAITKRNKKRPTSGPFSDSQDEAAKAEEHKPRWKKRNTNSVQSVSRGTWNRDGGQCRNHKERRQFPLLWWRDLRIFEIREFGFKIEDLLKSFRLSWSEVNMSPFSAKANTIVPKSNVVCMPQDFSWIRAWLP